MNRESKNALYRKLEVAFTATAVVSAVLSITFFGILVFDVLSFRPQHGYSTVAVASVAFQPGYSTQQKYLTAGVLCVVVALVSVVMRTISINAQRYWWEDRLEAS